METLLKNIMASPIAHGRFLFALSHLEYVGARKIAKALPASQATSAHLEHLMEEARHAALLRAQAEKLLDSTADLPDLRRAVETYLQAVDHGVDECLRAHFSEYRPFETYLVVSLVIEERAMKFYPLYQKLLPEGSIKGAVTSILKDEVGHLEDMQQFVAGKLARHRVVLEKCRDLEGIAYSKNLLPALEMLLSTISNPR